MHADSAAFVATIVGAIGATKLKAFRAADRYPHNSTDYAADILSNVSTYAAAVISAERSAIGTAIVTTFMHSDWAADGTTVVGAKLAAKFAAIAATK
jgi:hypothetical protein